ncbi:GDSL-type esterase/lipase family protein [Mucilaginibacter sp. AW1-3]
MAIFNSLTNSIYHPISPKTLKYFLQFPPLLFLFIALNNPVHAQQKPVPFASELKAFHIKDSLNMPPKDGYVFIGSSSVRKWDDFETRFPNPKLIRRGIGGSTLAQFVDYYMPYVVFPYEPAKLFVYVGENDIAFGATAEQLMANYKKLTELVKARSPKTVIYLMSVKYSPSRAKFSPVVKQTNTLLKAYVEQHKELHYVNVTDCLLVSDEHSDPSLFLSDMLHLNSKGYDRWAQVLRPYFME